MKSCLYYLGDTPNTPLKFMIGVIILNERTVQLKFRVTEKEKQRIINNTKKCGLSISEYLRKRALGYSPKALLPESFYAFSEKLGRLYDALETTDNAELQEKVLSLIDEVQLKLLSPKGGDE